MAQQDGDGVVDKVHLSVPSYQQYGTVLDISETDDDPLTKANANNEKGETVPSSTPTEEEPPTKANNENDEFVSSSTPTEEEPPTPNW